MDKIPKFPNFNFSEGFLLAVAMGRVQGFSTIDKFGINQNITAAGGRQSIWEYGGLYNYDDDGTAPIKYLSSSDDADTQAINVQGLDIDGNFVSQTKNLTGETNVVLNTPLWRVFRMSNEADAGNDLAGVCYCHTDPTPTNGVPVSNAVRAIINNGHNQTLMALYTIPKGKVGFLFRGEIGVELAGNSAALAEFMHLHYESRRYGKVFKVKKALSIVVGGQSNYQDIRSFPDIIPSLTDINLVANSVSADMGTWATLDILLVDERMFPETYLRSIGQIGY